MSSGARTRGAVTGLVAAAGAAWGHLWAGGPVTPGALLGATLVSVLVGVAVTRPARTSLPRLALTASVAQLLMHVLFVTSAQPTHHVMAHGAGADAAMLGVHALAGVVALAVAVGADRALVELARDVAQRWRVPASGDVVPTTGRPPLARTPDARPPGREQEVEGARGPPRVRHLTALAAAPAATPHPT